MKVGTDGVLLGCIAACPTEGQNPKRILDIGSGTGLIALMMAQRFPSARVTGVEVDAEAAAQARDNVSASPFADRVEVIEGDVRALPADSYDIIVSNPPYFAGDLTCPDDRRTTARHAVDFGHDELMACVARLLSPKGRAAVILPIELADRLCDYAAANGLAQVARCVISSNERKPPKRAVCQFEWKSNFADGSMPFCETKLLLLNPDGSMTKEYTELTRDFYLDKR